MSEAVSKFRLDFYASIDKESCFSDYRKIVGAEALPVFFFFLKNKDCGAGRKGLPLPKIGKKNMNRTSVSALLYWLAGFSVAASAAVPADTSRLSDIEEVLVVASPKEHVKLRRQPVSVSLFGPSDLERIGVGSVKDLSAFSPNLYMPDYGSRFSSAVYVRGVGSRINTPAVGLYVDNLPYADKSAYDFDFLDVERVDVLRGPQGTLYGRGAMGGLLRVFTADPLERRGTDVRLGGSTRTSGRHAAVGTYLHPARNFALALNGYYKGEEGFRRNAFSGKKADGGDAAGGRLRAVWLPAERLKFDYTAAFGFSDEDSNPYVYEGLAAGGEEPFPDLVGKITQNRQSFYLRRLFNTGLSTEWKARNFTLTSITAYQHLSDCLFMDQDYISADIFSLRQKQRAHTVSEELSFKGNLLVAGGTTWEWTMGAFLLYERKQTGCPVDFYADGVNFLNGTFRTALPDFITLRFTDAALPFYADLHSQGTNAALFHQSALRNFLVEGLSLTAGLRLDYDRHRLRLASPAHNYAYNFQMSMPPFGLNIDRDFATDAAFGGTDSEHFLQLLPKVALQYDLPRRLGHVYFSVSKGYRSGGYNLENYSDLSQALLRRNVMTQVRDFSCATISSLPMPEAVKQKALAGVNAMIAAQMPPEVHVTDLAYKPEYSWNHELGAHLDLAGRALQVDVAAFAMRTHNLQVAKFAPSGMGRVVVNAGRSMTWGAEAALRAALLRDRLSLSAAYGLAHSTFTKYELSEDTDYKGNHVPYAPTHTLALAAEFRQPLRGVFRAVTFGADAAGAGRIYWDEANTFSRPFSMQLGAHAAVEFRHDVRLGIWAKNLTNATYKTFAFESMGRRYAQYGDPFHLGVDVSVHF